MEYRVSKVMGTLYRFSRNLIKVFILFIIITAIATTIMVKASGDGNFEHSFGSQIVNDVTGLNPIRVRRTVMPETIDDIINAIRTSTSPISIGGGRFSQGGQVAYEDSLHIDMRGFDDVISIDEEKKEITVQCGITWHKIQEYVDPYNLSVRIMQTYSNFTVGGSLSVNVHGRYIGEGPVVNSVKSIKLVLADGSVVDASPLENTDLFYGAIGGYGGLGVIAEATLSLAENTKIERLVESMPVTEYKDYFFQKIRNNSDVVFHNADIYPPDYENILDVSWYKTDKPLTIKDRIISTDEEYFWGPLAAEFVANYDFGKTLREYVIDPIYYSFDRVVWRNWEASYDVRELEPDDRTETTYVLREYFIPVERLNDFMPAMRDIFRRNDANIINVSIRHAHKDPGTLLAWAKSETFAFVVYYQQGTDAAAKEDVKKWSLEMIDAVIDVGGTYYLPYQIFASPDQFQAAYPRSPEFFALKKKVDPDYRFRNQLWKQHYPAEQRIVKKDPIKNYRRGEEQTFLTIPEWYLVFNPLEYAQFLEEGRSPNHFPFFASINQYWVLYDRVTSITEGIYPYNSQYITMLRVIGISTTVEYMLKGGYENTVGRFTRWTAGDKNTPEDIMIAQAHRAYSDLIFNKAWYEFEFSSWIKRIWKDTDFFGINFIRKLERKLFFTLEYGFKNVYAKLIAYGAKTAYEQSDGLIYMTVKQPLELGLSLPGSAKVVEQIGDLTLLSVPRWGEFTKTIPLLAESNLEFEDISGNKIIIVSILSNNSTTADLKYSDLLFRSKLVSNNTLTRSYMLVNIPDLSKAIIEANERNFKIEHIFDY